MKTSIRTEFGKTKILESTAEGQSEKVLLVPGFGEGITQTKKLIGSLAARGLGAISFSQPRRRGYKDLDPISRQSVVVSDVLTASTERDEKVYGVAHSLGSGALLRAAQAHPDQFKEIIIMEPAGASGEQSFGELLGRTTKKVVKNQVGAARGQNSEVYVADGHYVASADDEPRLRFSNRVNTAQLASGATLAKNPALTASEAVAAGAYDMTEDVIKVIELGIPVHIVKAHADEMFDTDKVDERLEPLLSYGVSISSVADPSARHDTLWMQPERTANIIDQTIRS